MEVKFGGVGALAETVSVRRHAPLRSRPIDAPAAAPSSDRSPDAMIDQYLAILETSSGAEPEHALWDQLESVSAARGCKIETQFAPQVNRDRDTDRGDDRPLDVRRKDGR